MNHSLTPESRQYLRSFVYIHADCVLPDCVHLHIRNNKPICKQNDRIQCENTKTKISNSTESHRSGKINKVSAWSEFSSNLRVNYLNYCIRLIVCALSTPRLSHSLGSWRGPPLALLTNRTRSPFYVDRRLSWSNLLHFPFSFYRNNVTNDIWTGHRDPGGNLCRPR